MLFRFATGIQDDFFDLDAPEAEEEAKGRDSGGNVTGPSGAVSWPGPARA